MSAIADLERRIREARNRGGLYHPTNPADCYHCSVCFVFGKGGSTCWSCGSADVDWQTVPRWGGGAQQANNNGEQE